MSAADDHDETVDFDAGRVIRIKRVKAKKRKRGAVRVASDCDVGDIVTVSGRELQVSWRWPDGDLQCRWRLADGRESELFMLDKNTAVAVVRLAP